MNEAIARAHFIAEKEGWPWEEPVVAIDEDETHYKFLFFGKRRKVWYIHTNADARGCNVNIQIDDATGAILSKVFAPR